jgi:hypothetical protein
VSGVKEKEKEGSMSQSAAHTSMGSSSRCASEQTATAVAIGACAQEHKAQRIACTTRQADWHEVCGTHHGVGCGTHLQLHS